MHRTTRRPPIRNRPRVEALEVRALLTAAYALDPSFGAGYGHATIPLGLPSNSQSTDNADDVSSVVEEASGKIVVGGSILDNNNATSQIAVARFNADGSTDTSFGGAGEVRLPLTAGNSVSTLVQPNGKIVVATYGYDSGGNPTYVVARLNLDGTLDSSFGTNGIAEYPASTTTAVADRIATVKAVVMQSDGSIVLVGFTQTLFINSLETQSFAAVRLSADGVLDTTYGQSGTSDDPVTVNTKTLDTLTAAEIQSDNQVLLIGYVQTGNAPTGLGGYATEPAVLRLTTSGTLDTSYGGGSVNGVVLLPPDPSNPATLGESYAFDAALQPADGKLLLSGYAELSSVSTYPDTLYRLNTDGTLDTSFGTNGRATPTVYGAVVALQNGEILLADSGFFGNPGLIGLSANGSTDPAFVSPVVYGLTAGTKVTSTRTFSVQSTDGKILLAGGGIVSSTSGSMFGFAVARILPTVSTGPAAYPPPDPVANFGSLRETDFALYDPTSGSFIYESATSGNPPVTVPFGVSGVGQTIPAAADYAGIGQTQFGAYIVATGTYAIRPTSGNDQLVPFGVAGAGQTIPTPADFDGDGKADIAVYVPAYGAFGIRPSSGGNDEIISFGIPGAGQSIPVPADYFGTRQADIAVYLAASASFAIRPPGGGADIVGQFGMPGFGKSIPVPGDYDGSGKAELAVYIPSLGEFIYRPANGNPDVTVPFGTPGVGELPVPGDYDGSGHDEFAVYDPTRGFVAYRPANGNGDVQFNFGTLNDSSIPVATTLGSLPEFAAPSAGSGTGAFRPSVSTGSSSSSSTTSGLVVGRSATTVPTGPTLASIRVPRSLINQGNPDLEPNGP